jgi:hypothetical protein
MKQNVGDAFALVLMGSAILDDGLDFGQNPFQAGQRTVRLGRVNMTYW